MRPSLPAPQGPQPICLLSRFHPRTTLNRGRFMGVLSFHIDGFLTDLSLIWDHIQPKEANRMIGPLRMIHQIAFRMVLSHQTICPGYFASSSNIPWNPPTNFSSHPDCNNIAGVPSLSLRAALSAIPFVSER